MKLEERISHTLKEYYKTKEKPFTGALILLPEDFEVMKTSRDVIFTNSAWTFQGLGLLGQTDEDLGWTALEFTGWPKDNPELLTFIEEVHFRDLLYKDNK